MDALDRRTLLLGGAGMLVAGCGGGSDGTPKPTASAKGPNIVRPATGTVVTEADAAGLRDRLNQAMGSGDVSQLVALIVPGAATLPAFQKRWSRRLANFGRLDCLDGEWYLGVPEGRIRNAAGGQVEYRGYLVFAHTIKGCDGQQVVESMSAQYRKTSEEAPLELVDVSEVEESFDPSLWDVADVDAIETDHAQIVFRLEDANRAKAYAARIEAGAQRAFDVMPRPKGVDKIFYGLTWPEIDGKLWGGVAVGDADAHAYYHPFLDPAMLASGQKKASSLNGLPRATGRAGLHASSFSRPDFMQVAAHEGVHVLADQWLELGETPTWVIEGLAQWGESDIAATMAASGGRVRAAFSEFSSVALEGYAEFHDSPRESDYYACSAAVFACIEEQKGRDGVYEVAEAFYSSKNREAGADRLGRSEKDLMSATAKWLGR